MREQVIALAGICQAVHCVKSIAQTGQADSEDVMTMVRSVLQLSPESTEAVYGSIENLDTGLRALHSQLLGNQQTELDTGRYVVNVLMLEKRFSGNEEMQQVVRTRVSQTQRLSQYNDENLHELTESLASIYTDTLSTLPFKIQVTGNADHLRIPHNQSIIRALLLAAVRSAMLWRQVGGKRLQLLWSRKKLLNEIETMIRLPVKH